MDESEAFEADAQASEVVKPDDKQTAVLNPIDEQDLLTSIRRQAQAPKNRHNDGKPTFRNPTLSDVRHSERLENNL
ncbi:hypothetical protein VSR68_35690 [Paraburkholderia phymatum]|uniref:hypothetical protein n=1 Tax=Paraburkholderia phymatum TaxID=148447 RepID=UPI00317E1237